MPNLLITGANRGIGLEFTRQYAEAGWRVLACCRRPDEADTLNQLAAQYDELLSVHALDVSEFEQIDNLAIELADHAIDVLINNAGVYPESGGNRFGAIDYDAWQYAFRVNSMAPLKMAEAFVNQVARSRQKKIIGITSKMGSIDDNTSGSSYPYRSSKTALNMVVKSLAHDLAPRGISAAILHPGWVQTAMGGPGALITTEQSVTGMRRVIEQLTPDRSGAFYAYDGKEIPW